MCVCVCMWRQRKLEQQLGGLLVSLKVPFTQQWGKMWREPRVPQRGRAEVLETRRRQRLRGQGRVSYPASVVRWDNTCPSRGMLVRVEGRGRGRNSWLHRAGRICIWSHSVRAQVSLEQLPWGWGVPGLFCCNLNPSARPYCWGSSWCL